MNNLILILIALLITSIGFIKFVYFLSVGYAFSVVGLVIGILLLSLNKLNLLMTIMLLVIALYALRLGVFLVIRELKSKNYQKVMVEAGADKKMPIFVMVSIWIVCALMYYSQVSCLFFRLANDNVNKDLHLLALGLVISTIGLLMQSLADYQKSLSKKKDPKRFCNIGLYKIVRCPNYLGEILVWTGVFVSGITTLNSWWQYVIAIVGYVLIFYVMLSSTKRIELRQYKNYHNDQEFIDYIAKTPILFPLIPLRSLANWKWVVV